MTTFYEYVCKYKPCSKKFHDTQHTRKYCSHDCAMKDKHNTVETRVCKGCGKKYKTGQGGTKEYCSVACRYAAKQARTKARAIPKVPRLGIWGL